MAEPSWDDALSIGIPLLAIFPFWIALLAYRRAADPLRFAGQARQGHRQAFIL